MDQQWIISLNFFAKIILEVFMSLNTAIVSGRDPVNGEPMEVDSIPQFNELLIDVVRIIFQNSKADLPTLALVCRNWKAIADDEVFREMIRPVQTFGIKEWQKYIGVDAGAELPLPRCAYGDLKREDGLLTFIPDKVRVTKKHGAVEEVLLDNLEAIGNLIIKPKTDLETGYYKHSREAALKEKRQAEKPHWVWIKKEAIGKNKSSFEQQKLAKASRANVSGLIDTAISVFMEYVRSGERNFVWDPPVNGKRTWVLVNEQTEKERICLGFASDGLAVSLKYDDRPHEYVAVALARKFFI